MYQIKLYDKDKVFKKNINPNILKNKISFNKQINWWLWQLSLLLNLKFDWLNYKFTNPDTWENIIYSFIQWDLIEIYIYTNKLQTLIYVWYIEEIIDNITDYQELQLKVNWLASLFKRLIYNVWWNYTSNINQDTFSTIEDIKDFVNLYYNYFTIEWWLTWITWSYDLNYTNCYDLIENINKLSENYYWYLDWYNLIYKEKPITPTHKFTLQKDVVELNIENDTTDMVNYLILTYKLWTVVYQDATSISTYWKREKYISDTQVATLLSANDFWNNYISKNKDPKQRIRLIINSKYAIIIDEFLQNMINNLETYTNNLQSYPFYKNIHKIKPWETCKIRNIWKTLNNNLFITKVNYNKDIITLDLEEYQNFIWLIKQ